jgi:hypothetical protein
MYRVEEMVREAEMVREREMEMVDGNEGRRRYLET